MKNWFKFFMVYGMFFLLISCKSNDPIELKFNLEKGQNYYYTFTTSQKINQEMMGQKLEMDQEMLMGYSFNVIDDKEGIKTIKTTYDRIKMINKNGFMDLSYDSEDATTDSSNILRDVMGSMVNQSFVIDVDGEGNVVDVDGIEELLEAMMENVGAGGEMVAQNMKGQFSEEAIAKTMENGFKVFPKEPVKVGDTWEVQMDIEAPIHMVIKNDYKLKSVVGNIAKLEVNSTIEAGEKENMVLPGAEIEMSGTQSGTIEVDIPSGLTIKSKIHQNLDQLVKAQGMEIPMSITSDIVVEGKKL